MKNIFKLEDKRLRTISLIGFIVALLGLADGIYLTIAHFTQSSILACPSTSFINCDVVTTSSYSVVFGIPVSILGLAFFGGMALIQLPIFWSDKFSWVRMPRLIYSFLGLVSIFWFIYVELYKLNKICLYCSAIHLLTFISFILILIGTEFTKNKLDQA
jgi:uncharacterized membrane protein